MDQEIDLTFKCESISVDTRSMYHMDARIYKADKKEVMEHFEIEDFIKHFSEQDVIEWIGKERVMEYWQLTELP